MKKEIDVKSFITLKQIIPNKLRKFGSAKEYVPVIIEEENGTIRKALFTKKAIEVAIERAEKNSEDFIDEWESFWDRLFS
jgi:hypothetical protein